MRTLHIDGGSGPSTLLVGERLENLERHLPAENTVIITDTTVEALYRDRFPDLPVVTIGTGESVKTLETVSRLYEALIEAEADRSSFLVGIGGGIVCDITGFVASTYLRGIGFGFVSTTLLAQVDASVGGKNGVNFGGYKNMVGTFNQPQFVICDMALLKTLSPREVGCGMGEIVKHAAIADAGMFEFLEARSADALALDPEVIEYLVYESVRIKAGVVSRDEREAGERRKLNFGHTFGHAIEKTARVPHGEAVSAGMVVAAALSVNRGLLSSSDARRLSDLLEKLNLPTTVPADAELLLDALKRDKKRAGDRIHFVLLNGLGDAVIEEIAIAELEAVIRKKA